MAKTIDVLIIGSGQAGGPLATAFSDAGRSTVLVERDQLGGTCVNVGCTPTMTMIASGQTAEFARRGGEYGVRTGKVEIDMPIVRQRKRDIVEQWRSGSESRLLGKANPTTLFGEARFTGPNEVVVALRDGGEEAYAADTIVINTGERPAPLDVPGAVSVNVLNSTTVMELDTVPEHLIVVGGGYVGLEFAQLFRRLGAAVTIIHHGEHLLSREDEDVADAMRAVLEEDGISVLLNTRAVRVEGEGADVSVIVEQNGQAHTVSGSHILGAAGRIPNSDALNLSAAGIETDEKGYIPTSDTLETNVDGVYAVGDIRPGPKFTHISYDDYRVVKANLIDGERRSVYGRMVPYTVFTDPQLGRIGMSEREARDDGRNIQIAEMPMSSVARAVETNQPRGLMKVVVEVGTDRILGAAIVGMEGGEIASMIQIAMMGDVPYTALRDGIFTHPGLAESFNNLFNAWREE